MSFYGTRMHSKGPIKASRPDSPIDYVQIDSLVILKIIKHCHEEGSENADVQGLLLGLVMENRLEVTNCFATPRHTGDDEEESDYPILMLRNLRNVNVDHLIVGWYQSDPYGCSLARQDSVISHFNYQLNMEESIVLLYDPARTQRGFLAVQAYRISTNALKLCADGEFSPEAFKNNQMTFDKFFEEIPIEIKNSHLENALLCEFEERLQVDEGKQFMDMGSVSLLEKSLQPLMRCVDDVTKWTILQRQMFLKHQQFLKENALRIARGEVSFSEEEFNKAVKPIEQIQRLEALLNYCQTLSFCQLTSHLATKNIGKLFVTKALRDTPNKSVPEK